jgi:HK97 family phage major capsid protein
MRDATLKAIRKLKESTGQYLWQPGLQAGAPDLLLGRPVYVDPNAPAMTTGLDSILFGDVSKYWIREVGSVTVQRLDELYAANGQVGFILDRRVDGDLVDTAAVRVLTQA